MLTIECVDNLPSTDSKEDHIERSDIFPLYVMSPVNVYESYDEFMQALKEGIEKHFNPSEDDSDSGSDTDRRTDSMDDYEDPYEIIDSNISTIYTVISYPLSKEAIFKFTSTTPITYGMLLYAYNLAYQKIYELEEQDAGNPGHIPGMLNRNSSDGRFGIWGHDLGDLIYNGYSTIKIYDDYVICKFDCDS